MKKIISQLLLLVVLAGAGWGVYRYFKSMPSKQTQVPTTRVRQGDVIVRSYARGELRAVRSVSLTAPNLFGTVQVTRLAPLGALAKEKDLIVEFDDSEVASRLESRELELEQTDEQIKKAQADLAIRNNQDEVDLMRARYSVRRAELEVKRNPLLAEIDQKKNNLNLEESRRRLKQLESDIQSKREQAQAELDVLRQRRQRALLDINREKQRLMQVKLLTPMAGLVAIRQNRGSFSGQFGTQVPDIREGDQVQPGTPVADVLDLSELEVVARVGELDRANLREGQEVLIRLDAVPDKVFNGAIKTMSGTASANVFSSDPGKKFDVVFSIDMRQLLSSLGTKPEQVERIMALAETNRKKNIAPPSSSLLAGLPGLDMAGGGGMQMAMQGGMPGGMPGGGQGTPFMVQGPGSGGESGGRQGGGRGQGGPGGGGDMIQRMMQRMGENMTPEQQKKMQDAMKQAFGGKNPQDLTPEERQAAFAKLRELSGGQMPFGQRGQGGPGGQGGGGDQQAAGGRQRGEGGGPGGGNGRGGPGGPGGFGAPQIPGGFTQKEFENAALPAPPGDDAQLDVLLRPGLLADVEIIVEKVPNAIYVPNQAVFEKQGKFIVYVQDTNNRFVARPIQIAKRSETLSVVTSGVKPGDVLAMEDQDAKPGSKKGGEKKSSGGPMGAMPPAKGGQ